FASTDGSLHGWARSGHRRRVATAAQRQRSPLAISCPRMQPAPRRNVMETTRRTLLRNAGVVAAAGSMLFQPSAAAQGTGSPAPARAARGKDGAGLRSEAWCMLRTPQGDSLGLRRENRLLDIGKAGKALRVAVPASTDELLEGKNLAGLNKVLAAP